MKKRKKEEEKESITTLDDAPWFSLGGCSNAIRMLGAVESIDTENPLPFMLSCQAVHSHKQTRLAEVQPGGSNRSGVPSRAPSLT